MTKDSNMRINRLSAPVPEYRLDEIKSLLESHDLPVLLSALLKYMPESNFRLMVEDLLETKDTLLESLELFEQGRGTGQGALKILVNKGPDQELSHDECSKIGRIIASMDGPPKGYYVGMINFLGAACRIHHEIKTSYMEAKRQRIGNDNAKPEVVPDVVNRMFPGKEIPSDEELERRHKEEVEQVKSKFEETSDTVKQNKGIQQEEQAQQPQQQEAPPPEPEKPKAKKGPKQEATPPKPEPEPQPEPQPELEPEKKKPEGSQFKQYVPQITLSKVPVQLRPFVAKKNKK